MCGCAVQCETMAERTMGWKCRRSLVMLCESDTVPDTDPHLHLHGDRPAAMKLQYSAMP